MLLNLQQTGERNERQVAERFLARVSYSLHSKRAFPHHSPQVLILHHHRDHRKHLQARCHYEYDRSAWYFLRGKLQPVQERKGQRLWILQRRSQQRRWFEKTSIDLLQRMAGLLKAKQKVRQILILHSLLLPMDTQCLQKSRVIQNYFQSVQTWWNFECFASKSRQLHEP